MYGLNISLPLNLSTVVGNFFCSLSQILHFQSLQLKEGVKESLKAWIGIVVILNTAISCLEFLEGPTYLASHSISLL